MPDGLTIIAHRGASKDAPENTLAAFNLAWQQGADAIEGDFHQCKDNTIVCIHDTNTKRTAGQDLVVKDTEYQRLCHLDVGAYFGAQYQGEKIPTLTQVLATVPAGKKIYIEIKCDASVVKQLIAVCQKSALTNNQIIIISFDAQVIETLKKRAPQYQALWLLSLKKQPSNLIASSVIKTLETIQANGLSTSPEYISQSFVKKIIAAGFQYHVWTVDDKDIARRFVRWGAQSITTNIPKYLKQAF